MARALLGMLAVVAMAEMAEIAHGKVAAAETMMEETVTAAMERRKGPQLS